MSLGHRCFSRFRAATTSSVAVTVEAEFLADIDAFLAVAAEDVTVGTFTAEAALCVDTVSLVTQILIHETLVYIWEYENYILTDVR